MAAPLELARQLLGFNTINPPGCEADCMRFFADWLDDSGFEVSLSSFGEGRCNLIASLPGAKSGKPLAFTGHLDTVPLGNARWQYDAIYLAADALGKIQHFSPGAPHPLMKQPTLNVGRIEGGLNINSVPDRTRFDVDIRSAPNLQHATIRERLTTLLGESVTVSTLVDLPAVLSREDHAWIKQVYQRCQPLHAEPIAPRVVPYFTDASLLLPALGDPPCIILGPGEPSMAHQTDEYCLLSRLAEAEQLYGDIIRDWMASPPATKVKNE